MGPCIFIFYWPLQIMELVWRCLIQEFNSQQQMVSMGQPSHLDKGQK